MYLSRSYVIDERVRAALTVVEGMANRGLPDDSRDKK